MTRKELKRHRPDYYPLRLNLTVCIYIAGSVPTFVASQMILRHYGLI